MTGTLHLSNGKVYMIENCGNDCHVYKEENTKVWIGKERFTAPEEPPVPFSISPQSINLQAKGQFGILNSVLFINFNCVCFILIILGSRNRNEVVTFSVMVYYTKAFGRITPDVAGFVRQLVSNDLHFLFLKPSQP